MRMTMDDRMEIERLRGMKDAYIEDLIEKCENVNERIRQIRRKYQDEKQVDSDC